jgi:hypothetical protein
MLQWGVGAGRYEGAKAEKAVPFPGVAAHLISFASYNAGGAVMNTAVARRLALGDRVVWIGGDDRPSGAGTITRITAHEVEVRWDGGTVTRYRRAHLHNLRHVIF